MTHFHASILFGERRGWKFHCFFTQALMKRMKILYFKSNLKIDSKYLWKLLVRKEQQSEESVLSTHMRENEDHHHWHAMKKGSIVSSGKRALPLFSCSQLSTPTFYSWSKQFKKFFETNTLIFFCSRRRKSLVVHLKISILFLFPSSVSWQVLVYSLPSSGSLWWQLKLIILIF